MLRVSAMALVAAALQATPPPQQPTNPLRFEVASVKSSDPNPSSPLFIGMSADGAMVKYTNITLQDCIRGAYRVRDFQIVGPDWMTKARFEINARLPAGASADQIPEMLQALLAERFKLEFRREMREHRIYALVVADGGAKLKPAEAQPDNNAVRALGPDGKPRDLMEYGFQADGLLINAPAASIASLVWLMSRFTAFPVVDMTGIKGNFEFKLTFAPETTSNLPAGTAPAGRVPAMDAAATPIEPVASVFDAVKPYGLRLEARKAPIETLVVTHLEKTPTEN